MFSLASTIGFAVLGVALGMRAAPIKRPMQGAMGGSTDDDNDAAELWDFLTFVVFVVGALILVWSWAVMAGATR